MGKVQSPSTRQGSVTVPRTPPGPRPTIADLNAMGLTGGHVACTKCLHARVLTSKGIRLPDATSFPDVRCIRQFTCTVSKSRTCHIKPD